jgi:phosphatidylserine/phosphatidylglycerophosphate/cardiolipin synthase-like enzyme
MNRYLTLSLLLATLLAGCVADPVATELPELDGEEEFGAPVPGGKADDLTGGAAQAPLPVDADIDAALEALFAPDDPVTTTELRLVQEVVDARVADPQQFEEGQNPYAIHYAVYNLRNPRIIAALLEAEAKGVDVQVLIDAKQLDPAKTWNNADETFVDAGLTLVADGRGISAAEARTADMIGIKAGGLMHMKARIFSRPGGTRLLTGSMNPGDNAVFNEETLHLINEPRIVAKYQGAYRAVLQGRRMDNSWDEGEAVNVLFTPRQSGPKAGSKVIEWLEAEEEQILLMVFSLRNLATPEGTLLDVLSRKVAQGVPVYVITDRKQSDGVDGDGNPIFRNDDFEDRLRSAGVHVYEAVNARTQFTAMHHKVAVLGTTRIRVITDAANWTRAGLGNRTRVARNVESQLFLDTEKLDGGRTGRRYLQQWLTVLSRYAAQSVERDGEKPFDKVYQELRGQASWPQTPVAFEVVTETQWGDTVWVRGSEDTLGDWGRKGDGHKLGTDEDTYPSWSSNDAVLLPLGQTFMWKAVRVAGDGGVTWENGDNRPGRAALTAFGGDASVHGGTFR